MRDEQRQALTKLVYQHLADPRFRRRLTAMAPDKTRPIIVALRDDTMCGLSDKLQAAGGAANVVVPSLNGFIVLAMADQAGEDVDADVQVLAADCTVGLFVERLSIDGGTARYRLTTDAAHTHTEGGRAQVVALGG